MPTGNQRTTVERRRPRGGTGRVAVYCYSGVAPASMLWRKRSFNASKEGVAMLRTPVCELLGIEYPILSAGMGAAAGPELAAAVSNAGGCGVMGAGGAGPEFVKEMIRQVRRLTDRPFGFNYILDDENDEQ